MVPVLQIKNFVKPALGMLETPPVPARTSLVKFSNLDVDLGFLIFNTLDPYKTPDMSKKLLKWKMHMGSSLGKLFRKSETYLTIEPQVFVGNLEKHGLMMP